MQNISKVAGYDGVEIMGSEGYLINQFIAKSIPIKERIIMGRLSMRIECDLPIDIG